jgi:hypothetical protein
MSYNKITLQFFAFVMVTVLTVIIFFLIVIPDSATKKVPAQKQQAVTDSGQTVQNQINSISTFGSFTYGKSGLGNNLICYKVSPSNTGGKKILLTYEIHGYEDLFPKDGQVLVNIGNAVVKYFSENRNLLKSCELYVVPSANPDGLSHGVNNNGIGRCQVSLGVNINRDFDYCFEQFDNNRDHTLSKPFSAPETQALKNLLQTIKPDIVIDSHGWESGFIGDTELSNCYRKYMNSYALRYDKTQFTANEHGFFSAWASTQVAHALLVEYPPAATQETEKYEAETVSGITEIINAVCN